LRDYVWANAATNVSFPGRVPRGFFIFSKRYDAYPLLSPLIYKKEEQIIQIMFVSLVFGLRNNTIKKSMY
jgi:hypothetical protein